MIRLTPAQFDALWSDLGLGRLPYPLDVPRTGRREHLAELGGDRSHAEALLHVIANHTTAIDLVADVRGPVRALVAGDGRTGVLVTAGEWVELTAIRPTGLVVSLLGVLPQQEAGPGHALSIPLDVLDRAAELYEGDDSGDAWGGELDERSAFVRAGLSTTDASLMAELTTTRVAGGQFGVSHAGDRSPLVITWFDTPRGRYLMVRDGDWLSVAPADNGRIAARIDSLLAARTAA